jgi:hypothetical protein
MAVANLPLLPLNLPTPAVSKDNLTGSAGLPPRSSRFNLTPYQRQQIKGARNGTLFLMLKSAAHLSRYRKLFTSKKLLFRRNVLSTNYTNYTNFLGEIKSFLAAPAFVKFVDKKSSHFSRKCADFANEIQIIKILKIWNAVALLGSAGLRPAFFGTGSASGTGYKPVLRLVPTAPDSLAQGNALGKNAIGNRPVGAIQRRVPR